MIGTLIKKCRFLCLLSLFFTITFLQGQEQKNISNIEKIYLHTDRSTYFMGEDLWYKAYVVRASNNLLFEHSNILYVELISSDSDIIIRNKTSLEMGLGHGDFQLQDSLDVKPGKYQIRAYTNWNRNFGNDFVFIKDIEILDVFESKENVKLTQKSVSETKKRNNETVKKNPYTIDFLPEGGSLLENVASVIGFKAVNSNGKPIEIKGEIYDSDNELVSTFESVHDGMGKTQLLPIEGKSYYAKIKTENGFEFRQDLPKALKDGYALSYRNFKGRNILTISTNPETLAKNPNTILKIVCQARGINYLETTQTLTETSLSFELPKDKIPDGISQITLFDVTNKPQSERLVYFEKDHDLEVELSTDKSTYEPNEKAFIYVSSTLKSGESKAASFSLSVTDTNGIEENTFDSNICSYFLMESDIRGKVHHPGYYFDKTNPKRLEHLNNLLLTQGWRDFVWKTIPKVDEKNFYKVEKGITISGRVKQLFADKPLVNNYLTLALLGKKNHGIFSATTDSIGRFQFENLMFSGKVDLFLNTRDERGKFRGQMLLDSIERSPMVVRLKKEVMQFPDTTKLVATNVYNKFIAYGVKPENRLNEVEIKAKSKMRTTFGIPDYSYVLNRKDKEFTNIYQVFDNVPGVWQTGDSIFIGGEKGRPGILIDGDPVLPYQLDLLSPEDVIRVDIIKGKMLGMLYNFKEGQDNGIISIITNGKWWERHKTDRNQTLKKELEGYYLARVFYIPDKENPDEEKPDIEFDKKIDVRNTIYWNPFVHPDKTGEASVDYYNTKVETKVKVALEGITSNGIPVVKTTYYTIKK